MANLTRDPIVIHKGKRNRRQIRRLKKGRGKLVDQVERQVEKVQKVMGEDAAVPVPIVIYYDLKNDIKSEVKRQLNKSRFPLS